MEQMTNAVLETVITIKVPLTESELAEIKAMDEVTFKAHQLLLKAQIEAELGANEDELEIELKLVEGGSENA